MPDCRLYLISPERIDHPSLFAADLRAALDGGDVAAFQLRLKDVDDAAIARCADTLRPVCQQRDVAFFLNDRPDLALKLDCDGVHVGQEDMPYREARRIMGTERQVGVTCKASRHLAMEAAEAGADYVAFGAFYPTTTKPSHYRPPPAILVRPDAALEAVRSAMLLGGVLPEMRAETEALAAELADLVRIRKDIAEERDLLAKDVAALSDERQRMTLLIGERQRQQSETEKALETERQRAAALARQVDNLRDLIAKLEQGLDGPGRAARAAARAG